MKGPRVRWPTAMSADEKHGSASATFVVIRGKGGSGKSTLAIGIERRLGFVRVDYDAEMARTYHRYGVGTEAVRDLARQEGRISAGQLAHQHLAVGRSVVCDADVRDARELSDIVGYDESLPPNVRVVVIRLEIDRDEARRRKVTPEWNEFRINPRNARRFFEVMWTYPFSRIEGEQKIDVTEKSAEQVVDSAVRALGPEQSAS
jgi:predicted kinase